MNLLLNGIVSWRWNKMGQGIITKEYTVWCWDCNEWHQYSFVRNVKEMKIYAKSIGWAQVKRLSNGVEREVWICPKCKEAPHE